MKRMTFALACASTAALFAGTIHQATFEDYSKGFSGLSGKDDTGSSSDSAYWTYLGSGSDDGSTVKAYKGADDPDNLDKPAGTQLSGEIGDKYLELSTEGGTLWRSVNEATDTKLGAGEELAELENGLFIDTMVQFTPTEDGEMPETDAADKIALWLDVDKDGNTNLCVKAAVVDDYFNLTPAKFILQNTGNIQAGTWYRLTIESIADITGGDGIPGFKIYIDGQPMAADKKTVTDDYADLLEDDDIDAKLIFASLAGVDDEPTITAVGFKGSGALDDLTITDENPIKEEPAPEGDIAFTITTADGVTASWSTTADGEFTTYAEGAKAPAGTIYVKLTTADGGMKIVEQTVSADDGASNAYDLSAETFGWAEYLGAAVDGAYVIDNAAELAKFGAKAIALGTKDLTFKLGADIDMAAADPWAGIGTYADGEAIKTTPAFEGTFDGAGFKISNICMTERKGSGFFNVLRGATVQNLTIDTVTYASDKAGATMAAKMGGAMLAGNIGPGTTVKNVTLMGSNASATNPVTYNAAGLAARIEACGGAEGAILIENCVNKAAIYCSYTKIGGMCPIVSGVSGDEAPVTFKNCVNEGAITAVDATKGTDGVAGILAYTQGSKESAPITFIGCEDKGTLTGAVCGGILAKVANGYVVAEPGNKTKADVPAMKVKGGTVSGFGFATVADGVATTVADSAAVAGATLKVMLAGAPVTLADLADTITLDETLAKAAVSVTDTLAADGYGAIKDGNVYSVGINWSTVLGDAIDGAYVIDDETEFVKFTAHQDLGTEGITFKLGADIALTNTVTPIGVGGNKDKLGTEATYKAGAFKGTFDGQNHTISGVVLPREDYVGLFGSLYGATVKNLTVAVKEGTTGFESEGGTADFCGGLVAGVSVKSTIENVTTAAGSFTAQKAAAGIVGYAAGGTVLKNCVNNLNVTSLGNEKVAGLVGCAQNSGNYAPAELVIDGCTNNGNIECKASGKIRAALLVSYTDFAVKFQGTVTARGTVTQAGSTSNIQSIININGGSATVADGAVITAPAGMKSTIHNGKARAGLNYATVADGIATFVADSAAVNGANLKVMTTGNTITLANIGDSITLDMTLATATVETSAANATVQQAGNVWTVVSAKPPYPAYIGDDAAKQAKYDAWATANNIAAADFPDAEAANQKAYLLNAAPGKAAEDAEKAFKIKSITVDATGKVTVTPPEGQFNGTVEIQGAATLAGPWAAKADNAGQKFFKAVLK